MGLIKAIAGSANGVMADQWKECFYSEPMPKDVLVTKGVHRTGKRSSNTKGTDNVITNGSVLAVADGQCMLIVEQGKVVDICAEPGEYIFDSMTAPSVFTGGLGAGILSVLLLVAISLLTKEFTISTLRKSLKISLVHQTQFHLE